MKQQNSVSKKLKPKLQANPKYILWLTLIFAIILISIAAYDIYQTKKEAYRTKTEEAVSLLRATQKSAENVYLSSLEVENLILDKLINNALLISKIEESKKISIEDLNEISRENNIDHIYFFSNSNLEKRNTNIEYSDLDIQNKFAGEIDSIIKGKYDYFVAGSVNDDSGSNHLLIIHKRKKDTNGFIALSVESKYLLEFRKKIGIGRLLQRIADEKDIEYIIIQDEKGIITASEGIKQLSSLESDNFLLNSVDQKMILTRVINFNGNEIFEAVKPFRIENEIVGIIRIGLSLELVNNIINTAILRSIVISIMLFLVGTVLIIYIANTRSLTLLKNEHRKIQTYNSKILDNMSDGVIVVNSEGMIRIFNKASENIFDISSESAVNRNFNEIFGTNENLIEKTFLNKMPVLNWESTIEINENKRALISGSTSIIYDDENKIESVVTVLRDLTEHRNLEELQKRKEKLSVMGELAANVAHEIKNPLNSISITAQRFEKEFSPVNDKEEYYQLLKNVRSEIKRVTNIINQFLKFARPPKVHLQKINIKNLIDEICLSFKSQAIQFNIDFKCTTEDYEIEIDSEQIRQALVNIVQNAFDSVQSNGKISIGTKIFEEHLTIEIKDNGSGITKEDIDKIFNLYFTTKQNGTGLGLSIVNQIITAHGGKIKVESNPGKETIFKIELPVK